MDDDMQISVTDAEGQLTELVRRAEAGDEIILTRHGKAVVRLLPVKAVSQPNARRMLLEAARSWEGRLDIHTARTDERPADALLIRPDAYIAWAAATGEPGDTAAPALTEALSGWFGPPGPR